MSGWSEIDAALEASARIFPALQARGPEAWAAYLDAFADLIEAEAEQLVDVAHGETSLPKEPRLRSVEIPRTTGQLREAARVAVARTWREPTLSPAAGIAAYRAPIPGAVVVFGPNNFPFAFNGVGGGDFAAAVATGHPIVAKANPGHPATTRLLADLAYRALDIAGLPREALHLLDDVEPDDGFRLVADRRVAAIAFTGSRRAGLALKAAADAAGRPIYLEMSSVNPVVVLPGAWEERGAEVAEELAQSMALASGQFCTSPGIVFAIGADAADGLIAGLVAALDRNPPGPLLTPGVADGLAASVRALTDGGAEIAWRSAKDGSGACWYPTTVLRVDGATFAERPAALQHEAFGNVAMVVALADADELVACLSTLEGNLTGTIYATPSDDLYPTVAEVLRPRVGRLLKNKPPTGVAVVAAMNHGGPYPATGHPGFTAVGFPASMQRFTMLQSFDNVDDQSLPPELQASNPLGLQRFVEGRWTEEPVAPAG